MYSYIVRRMGFADPASATPRRAVRLRCGHCRVAKQVDDMEVTQPGGSGCQRPGAKATATAIVIEGQAETREGSLVREVIGRG